MIGNFRNKRGDANAYNKLLRKTAPKDMKRRRQILLVKDQPMLKEYGDTVIKAKAPKKDNIKEMSKFTIPPISANWEIFVSQYSRTHQLKANLIEEIRNSRFI